APAARGGTPRRRRRTGGRGGRGRGVGVAVVTRPAIALPDHEVGLAEILGLLQEAHAQEPRLHEALRARPATTGAPRRAPGPPRRYPRPLGEASAPPPPHERAERHDRDALALAADAARQALDQAGVRPDELGCLITSSTSGYGTPGLDAYLINELALPPT